MSKAPHSELETSRYFIDDDRLYIIMELIEGQELLTEVNKRKGSKQTFFDEEDAAVIIK